MVVTILLSRMQIVLGGTSSIKVVFRRQRATIEEWTCLYYVIYWTLNIDLRKYSRYSCFTVGLYK